MESRLVGKAFLWTEDEQRFPWVGLPIELTIL